jgi:hypothetical protein
MIIICYALQKQICCINRTYTATTFVFALITTIVLSAAAGGVSYITMQGVDAEMSNNSSMTGSMMRSSGNMSMASNMMAIPAKAPQLNITTAAPPVSPATFKSLASQMHIDLINATTIAQKWVGSNSHAVSSMIGIFYDQNGSPVYTIWIIDSNSGLHQIVVDPQSILE